MRQLGPNVYSYLSVPVSQTYFNPWCESTGGVDPATGFLAVLPTRIATLQHHDQRRRQPISTGATCKCPRI